MILHTSTKWLRQNINQGLKSQKTPHNGRAMGCLLWGFWKNKQCVITAHSIPKLRGNTRLPCIYDIYIYDYTTCVCIQYGALISWRDTEWCLVTRLPLQWRHNESDGVSNYQSHDCLLNCLFRHKWKKILKLRATGLCARNSPVTGEFSA